MLKTKSETASRATAKTASNTAKSKIAADAPLPVATNCKALPDASEFDAKKIKRATLSKQGWVVPG